MAWGVLGACPAEAHLVPMGLTSTNKLINMCARTENASQEKANTAVSALHQKKRFRPDGFFLAEISINFT